MIFSWQKAREKQETLLLMLKLIDRCDLAGSERLKKTHAEGERLSEAQHINSSLLELGWDIFQSWSILVVVKQSCKNNIKGSNAPNLDSNTSV